MGFRGAPPVHEEPCKAHTREHGRQGVLPKRVEDRIACFDCRFIGSSCHGLHLSDCRRADRLLGVVHRVDDFAFHGLSGVGQLDLQLLFGLLDLLFDGGLHPLLDDVNLLDRLLAEHGRVELHFDRRQRLTEVRPRAVDLVAEGVRHRASADGPFAASVALLVFVHRTCSCKSALSSRNVSRVRGEGIDSPDRAQALLDEADADPEDDHPHREPGDPDGNQAPEGDDDREEDHQEPGMRERAAGSEERHLSACRRDLHRRLGLGELHLLADEDAGLRSELAEESSQGRAGIARGHHGFPCGAPRPASCGAVPCAVPAAACPPCGGP